LVLGLAEVGYRPDGQQMDPEELKERRAVWVHTSSSIQTAVQSGTPEEALQRLQAVEIDDDMLAQFAAGLEEILEIGASLKPKGGGCVKRAKRMKSAAFGATEGYRGLWSKALNKKGGGKRKRVGKVAGVVNRPVAAMLRGSHQNLMDEEDRHQAKVSERMAKAGIPAKLNALKPLGKRLKDRTLHVHTAVDSVEGLIRKHLAQNSTMGALRA